MRKHLQLCLFVLLVFSFTSCVQPNNSTNQTPNITCTTNIVGDLVAQLAPSNFVVNTIMGPGVDPHIYKAKPKDIEMLQQADIIFYNGLHLEGKMAEILENLGKSKSVYALSSGLADSLFIRDGSFQGGIDPHFWFDNQLWEMAAEYVATTLFEAFPNHKTAIENNLKNWKQANEKNQQELEELLANIEVSDRVLVTAHDAFSYYARKYQFELISIQGLSTQADFSVKTIDEISNYMITKDVKCAFFESSVPKKSIETLLLVCQQKGLNIREGGTLFSDALGAKDKAEGTYFGMLKYNTQEISNCLQQP